MSNVDYTFVRTGSQWNILLDSEGLTNGYYNITLKATDGAGNVGTYTIGNVYLDTTVATLGMVEELIYVGSDNIYNNTITNELYFNEEEYLWLTSVDEMFDGFIWNGGC